MRAKQMKKQRESQRKRKLMALWGKWMTERQWEALEVLQHLPPFDKPNIIDHMISHASEWERFIHSSGELADPVMPGSFVHYGVDKDDAANADGADSGAQELAEAAFDIDELFNAEDSVQRQVPHGDEAGAGNTDADSGSQGERPGEGRAGGESPALRVRADEDDDAFYKRRSVVDEDHYVGKKIIDGLPEYTTFSTAAAPKGEDDRDSFQLPLNKLVLRFCILRIFRPELMEGMARRFVELFLDASYAEAPPF